VDVPWNSIQMVQDLGTQKLRDFSLKAGLDRRLRALDLLGTRKRGEEKYTSDRSQ
jgi:hypothetical protein